MKKTYKYLAFAFGMMLMNSTCYATQEQQPPKQGNNDEEEENTENVYQQILAAIPADNPERRNAFLAEVCRKLATEKGWKKDNKGKIIGRTTIKDIVCDKLKEKDSTLTADSPKVTCVLDALQKEKTWNDDSSGLEDVKDAVQELVQVQGGDFFGGISNQYMRQLDGYYDAHKGRIEGDFKKFVSALKNLDLSKVAVLQKLVNSFNKDWIGCLGCALTSDLIMDITRRAVSRLNDNPDDKEVLNNLNNLYDTLNDGNYTLAHEIPNLPAIATKIARNFRTKRIKDFSEKDIGDLIEAVQQDGWQKFGFTIFQNRDLGTTLDSLSKAVKEDIKAGVRKAIPSKELKKKLLEGIKNKGTGNQLEQSIDSLIEAIDKTRDVSDIVHNMNNSSTPSPSSNKHQVQKRINAPSLGLPTQTSHNLPRSNTTSQIGGYTGGTTTQTPTQQQKPQQSSTDNDIFIQPSITPALSNNPSSSSSSDDAQSAEKKDLKQKYEEKSKDPGVKVWATSLHTNTEVGLIIDVYKNGKCNEYMINNDGDITSVGQAEPNLVQVEPVTVNGYQNMYNVSISDGNANNKINLTCKFENNKCNVMLRDTDYNGKLVVEADLVGTVGKANVNNLVIKSNDDYFVNYAELYTTDLCVFAHEIENKRTFNSQTSVAQFRNPYELLQKIEDDKPKFEHNKFHNHPLAICNAKQITTRYIGESIFEGNTHVDTIDSDGVVTLGQPSQYGYSCDINKIKAQQVNIYTRHFSKDGNCWNYGAGGAKCGANEIVDTSDQPMEPNVIR